MCIMDMDVNEFSDAWLTRRALDTRGSALKLNISDDETTKLKELCDSRDNKEVIEYLMSKENVLKNNAADLFNFAVFKLTCNDDPESLKELLEFGQKWPKLEVQWKEEKDVLSTEDPCLSRNPIMIASQQVTLEKKSHSSEADIFRASMDVLGFFTSVATGSPKLNAQMHRNKMKGRRRRQQMQNPSWSKTKSRNLEKRSIIDRKC